MRTARIPHHVVDLIVLGEISLRQTELKEIETLFSIIIISNVDFSTHRSSGDASKHVDNVDASVSTSDYRISCRKSRAHNYHRFHIVLNKWCYAFNFALQQRQLIFQPRE